MFTAARRAAMDIIGRDQFRGFLRSYPARTDLTMPISEKLIVEHYSR